MVQSIETYTTKTSEVRCLVYVSGDTIHVLDVNHDGTISVTNGIDQIQQQILKKHQLSGDVSNYKWILYGTDGIASQFHNQNFIVPQEADLLKQFVNLSKKMSGSSDLTSHL